MSAVERDIEETRVHLGDTVDALATKAEADKRRLGIAAAIGGVVIVALVLWRWLS
jgi:hypothetical protein